MNSIKFETRIWSSSIDEIEIFLDDFFIEIKAEVFKKAKASQKKYFEIRDAFHYLESRKKGFGSTKELDIKLVKYLKEKILIENNLDLRNFPNYKKWCKENDSYCCIDEMTLYNTSLELDTYSVKNFHEDYNRLKENYINELIETLKNDKLVILDFEIEFYFTDFSLREHCTPLTHSLPSKEEIEEICSSLGFKRECNSLKEMESPKKEKSLTIVFLPKSIKESKRIMRSYGVRYPPSLSHRKTRCAPGGLEVYMKHT